MTSKSIISPHFDKQQEVIKLNDIQQEYKKKYYNLINDKVVKFEKLDCPCGSNENQQLISSRDKFGLNVTNVICSNCGLVRQNPCLDEKSLSIFYDKIYRPLYLGEVKAQNIQKVFQSQITKGKVIYDLLNKYNYFHTNSKILEIGCSAGGILKYFQDKNHQVKGCDFDSKYIDYGKKQNLDLIVGSSAALDKNIKYDLIILSHVLEHFKNLKNELEIVFSLLKDNGLIFIQVPGILNEKDYYQTFERCDFLFYVQNAHNYYFTKNTLVNTLTYLNFNYRILHADEKVNLIIKKEFVEKNIVKNDYTKIVAFLKKNNSLRIYKKILYFIKNKTMALLRIILKLLFLYDLIKAIYIKKYEK